MATRGEKRRQEQQQPDRTAAVALIAAALVSGASAQAMANSLSPRLKVPVAILLPLLRVATGKPMNYGARVLRSAKASSQYAEMEPSFRAAYVDAASRRVQSAIADGTDLRTALVREQRYFNQHLEAMANRLKTATAVDKAAQRYGDELGWYAKMDSRTSDECRQANGKNFNASKVPPIGYPGAVHPHCRCKPGKAHATSKTVYTVRADRKSA